MKFLVVHTDEQQGALRMAPNQNSPRDRRILANNFYECMLLKSAESSLQLFTSFQIKVNSDIFK